MFNYIRLILIPLTFIFWIITIIRNFLYDFNILKVIKVDVPLISIGNISTGGTGKSPFVIFLSEYFMKKGKKVSVISRGYKSNNNNITIVTDGIKILCEINDCGDEPFMIAESLLKYGNNFSVIAYKNRIKASELAISKFHSDIIILDDTFQHRKIYRDLDIVIFDSYEYLHNKLVNTLLIPSGNLRECNKNVKRADLIIQNNKFNNFDEISKFAKYNRSRLQAYFEVVGFFDYNENKIEIERKNIIAFAGIAKPDSFFKKLEKSNCIFKDKIVFSDHHNYREEDFSKLLQKYSSTDLFITTEKDFVKIKTNKDFIEKYNICYLKIELKLDFIEYLEKLINQKIKFN